MMGLGLHRQAVNPAGILLQQLSLGVGGLL